jgi:hypothetical protein
MKTIHDYAKHDAYSEELAALQLQVGTFDEPEQIDLDLFNTCDSVSYNTINEELNFTDRAVLESESYLEGIFIT